MSVGSSHFQDLLFPRPPVCQAPISWVPAVSPGPSSSVTAQGKGPCCHGELPGSESGCPGSGGHRRLVALGSAVGKGWCWGCFGSRLTGGMEVSQPEPIPNGAEPCRSTLFAPAAGQSRCCLSSSPSTAHKVTQGPRWCGGDPGLAEQRS